MIIARNEQEVDRILDYFIADGFEACTRPYKPDLNEWREWIKEEDLKKSVPSILIFVPHWDYDIQENRIVKSLNWHSPETLESFIEFELGTQDENKTHN